VEPISPTLMFVKVTLERGCTARTCSGTPSSSEQFPRSTPGEVVGRSSGAAASSQFMWASVSSQSDMTRTMPRSRAAPILFKPPFAAKSLGSAKAAFCALQKPFVIELPRSSAAPGTPASEFAMTLPSCT
jgi:hypothetical protein